VDNTGTGNHPVPEDHEQDHVVVGIVGGACGLRGDLKVQILSDAPDRFSSGNLLYLDGRPVRVQRSRPAKGGVLVKFDIVEDRTQAERLRGRELTIPLDQVKPLPGGSYYHFQVLGMGVWSERGEYLGKVTEILSTGGGHDVYVIGSGGQKDLLLPAIDGVILDVDVQENRMIVRPLEGPPE
jgi:16S rRNA processing protein RimM